jgi:hypothetical protein
MLRLRAAVVFAVLLLTLGVGAGALAGEEAPGRDAPAVTVGDEAATSDDEAWTFRYLVPTLLAMSVVGLGFTALAYSRRVKGRYRVAR